MTGLADASRDQLLAGSGGLAESRQLYHVAETHVLPPNPRAEASTAIFWRLRGGNVGIGKIQSDDTSRRSHRSA